MMRPPRQLGARWLPGKHQTVPDVHGAWREHCEVRPAGPSLLKGAATFVQFAPTGKRFRDFMDTPVPKENHPWLPKLAEGL